MKNLKSRLYTIAATAGLLSLTLAEGAVPALAAVNVSTNSNFVVDGSVIGTAVRQGTHQTTIQGGNVNINKTDTTNLTDSYIQTYIQDQTDITNILGSNINLWEAENTKVSGSAINTLIQTKTDIKNLVER